MAQTLYSGGFGLTLLFSPSMYFKGGAATYWNNALKANSANEWFAQALGTVLTFQALASYMSAGKKNAAVATMNFYSNLVYQYLFYKALSNDDANKGMWKVQNVLGLVMLYLSGSKYMVV